MLEFPWVIKLLALSAITYGFYFFLKAPGRSAEDVLNDLQDFYDPPEDEHLIKEIKTNGVAPTNLLKGLQSEVLTLGNAPTLSSIRNSLIIGALAASLAGILVGVSKFAGILLCFISGAAIVYIASGVRLRARQAAIIQEIEQSLPVVMERLVMAVQSGLDIVAALNALVRLDQENRKTGAKSDVVTELLEVVINLSESGLPFCTALNHIAEAIPCVALRHGFVHLALAYEEGGELVGPLRELSDATQLYYQESVEDRIARLPVKATLPLVLTFAGLLICFITAPILQVMDVLTKVTLK